MFVEMPRQTEQAGKVEQLHLDTNGRPIGIHYYYYVFEMPRQFKLSVQGRTTTSRYK